MPEAVPVAVATNIECPYCEAEIPRPRLASTATCSNCGKSIALENKVLNGRYVFGGEVLTRGTIFVGPKGIVKGNLSATEVEVEGAVDGTVKAVERLTLKKTGSIVGDLTAKKLVVEEGASVLGELRIGQPRRA